MISSHLTPKHLVFFSTCNSQQDVKKRLIHAGLARHTIHVTLRICSHVHHTGGRLTTGALRTLSAALPSADRGVLPNDPLPLLSPPRPVTD